MSDIVTNLTMNLVRDPSRYDVAYGVIQLFGCVSSLYTLKKRKDGGLWLSFFQYKKKDDTYADAVWLSIDTDEAKAAKNEITQYVIDKFNSMMSSDSVPQQQQPRRSPLVSIRNKEEQKPFENTQLVSETIDDDDDEILKSCLKKG